MGNRLQEQIAITDYLVPLHFGATNIGDAAGTAVAYPSDTAEYIMPWSGSVVGISAASNADYTGGVLTFNPTVNGTANTGLAAVLEDTVQRDTGVINSDIVNFTAGQRLGVKWTKSGTVAPTTTDVSLVLWVLVTGVSL